MPAEFKARYGYDVLDGLAALFVDYEGSREFCWDYYRLCHELFINGFVKVIYDWCDAHGCKLTGHAVEEANLHGQMWCCGGVMPFYEYEHIPGIDYLSRNIATDIAPRQLGSACAQLGKKQAISEMFGACGWDVTPRELKRIAELQYANGVNMMCQHLYSYSMRGQRKRDWPCHYSEHLPWQKAMGEFNNYFNNLGYTVSRGSELARVLVIHPIHAAYLTYKREADYESVKKLQDDLVALNALLSENQIPYHFGDECMMAKMGSVEGDKIKVGLCTYDHVVVPAMETIDKNTADMLKKYIANGGRVYLYGDKPSRIDGRIADLSWLEANCTFADVKATADLTISAHGKNVPALRQMARATEYGRIFFITNITGDTIPAVNISVKNCRGLYALDMNTLEYSPVPAEITSGGCTVILDFEDSGSYVLVEAPEAIENAVPAVRGAAIPLSGGFTLARPVDNMLTLDYAQISYDGVNYEKPRPIILIKDMLLRSRYSGDLWLKYTFNVDEIPGSLRMAAEPLDYKAITVNGASVSPDGGWWFDRKFATYDVAPCVHTGVNEVVMQIGYFQRDYVYYVMYGGVSESLRNCLNFDTEIEFIYLVGDFCVKTDNSLMQCVSPNVYSYTGGFTIASQKSDVDISNITLDGYPFFAGEIEASTLYNYTKGGATELAVNGRYMVIDVSVNGKYAGRIMFAQHLDLSGFLAEGDNVITLKLYNSNRNLLGPHHYVDAEPLGVPPTVLSLESQWDGEESPMFADRYSFVRFGIDC